MVRVEMLTNAEFGRLIGPGNSIQRVRDELTGIEFNMAFAGPRGCHYDMTPATPDDMAAFRRAFGQLSWLARPMLVIFGDLWVPMGIHGFMHGSFIGNGNPGPGFHNRSNNGPFNTPDGGHVCGYLRNSSGGTTGATVLPAGNNRLARPEANRRAATFIARGLRSRAAAHEAYIAAVERLNSSTVPPTQQTTVNPTLRQGNPNTDAIVELQALLNMHGANPQLRVDGVFGPLTDTAVRNFQRLNVDVNGRQLAIDGVVGPLTWGALLTELPDITLPGTPVDVRTVEVTGSVVNIRTGAGTDTSTVGEVRPPRRLQIDMEMMGQDGNSASIWGRIANDSANFPDLTGRWIALRLTRIVNAPAPTPTQETPKGRIVTVNVQSSLNVRKGPSTTFATMFATNSSLRNGDTVRIVEESTGLGARLWGRISDPGGRFDGGWIALDHTR